MRNLQNIFNLLNLSIKGKRTKQPRPRPYDGPFEMPKNDTDLDQSKLFYVSLCIFFIVGAFVTAYVSGQNAQTLPDNSWQEPKYFVGYFNNYLNEKVNPMTLGDVFVTEYIEHPSEPTGVIPLYPTQAVVQERAVVNCTITEVETYLVPDDNNTYGTTVGVGLYIKKGLHGEWRLKGYDTVSTAGDDSQAIQVTIETPRITFDAEGGRIRVVITNFGTEINEAVYVPTIMDDSKRSLFSGINTIVDSEEALYLVVKNEYQMVKGYRYYVDYKSYTGIQLHKVAYKLDKDQTIAIASNKIIALFDYPSLTRKDSMTNRFSQFRSMFDNYLTIFDPKLITNLEDLLIQVPIIGSFFKYTPFDPALFYTTDTLKTDITIQNYADTLIQLSQDSLTHAAQPAIQTMILTRDFAAQHPSEYYDLMDYFEQTFISDYNELETNNEYVLTQLDYKTYELQLVGQQSRAWVFDLTRPMSSIVKETNLLPGYDDTGWFSFRSLMNVLNRQYYSSKERGTTGINAIKGRTASALTVERDSGEYYGHLVTQIENIAVPNYNALKIVSSPSLGTFTIQNKAGQVVQKFDMFHDGELSGQSVSLLESQTEKVFLWLQKTFGPWSNIQIPDERPIWDWDNLVYTMDDDRDVDGYFLGGDTNNVNSFAYNGVVRPLDFTLQYEDTPRGWYRGNATHDYAFDDPVVLDPDWDTGLMGLDVGLNTTLDIEIIGGTTTYYQYQGADGHYMDNNGWVMLDLGDEVPDGQQWRVSFDFWKTESDPSSPESAAYFSSGAGTASADFYNDTKHWYEAGIGVSLTNDIGIKQLMERHDVDLLVPIQLDHVSGYYEENFVKYGLPPDGAISLNVYDPFYVMNGTMVRSADHFPGGTLWDKFGTQYYHQMTYPNTLRYGDPLINKWEFTTGGVLLLEPESWHHVDLYYDGITNMLNVFVDNKLVRANVLMPALKEENDPTLENIWFYNYGMQNTYISNLEVSGQVPPMVTPFKSSVVDIGRLTQAQGLTNPTLIKGPYQYGATGSYSLWPETNLIADCNIDLYQNTCDFGANMELGQTINLGQGTEEIIYWVDVNGNGVEDPSEFTTRDLNYFAKSAIIANKYTDSEIHYQGLIPLLGDNGATIWDRNLNYTGIDYTVGAGAIQTGDALDIYPDESRYYEHLIEMDDFELLLLALLQTDYEFDTTDFWYPDDEEVYHEVLWGEAVNDIIDNGQADVLDMTGWGQVLLSLVSMVDAVSVYKVSPLWNDEANIPWVNKFDQPHFDDFYGHDKLTVEKSGGSLPDDMDKFWTLGYGGVVSYEAGGDTAVSSFYGGDGEVNVTYGGRKWYAFGLNVSDLTNYNMADKGGYLTGTPFEGYEDISEKRLVIQGAREFLNGTTSYETYTLNLATHDLAGDGTPYEEIVIPVKWTNTTHPEIIYDDPSDLFVRVEDKDNTGYFERYYTGPLGKYLQPKYMVGNVIELLDLSVTAPPMAVSADWIMESISGLVTGFLDMLPLMTEIFTWITSSVGLSELLGGAIYAFIDMWDLVARNLVRPTQENIENWVEPDVLDPEDGTYLDDGEKRVNDEGEKDIDGDVRVRWGIARNGLDDDYDQGISTALNLVPMILRVFIEVLGGSATTISELNSIDLIQEALIRSYNEIAEADFIGFQSEYSEEKAHATKTELLDLMARLKIIQKSGKYYKPIENAEGEIKYLDGLLKYIPGKNLKESRWVFQQQGMEQLKAYISLINNAELSYGPDLVRAMIEGTARGGSHAVDPESDITSEEVEHTILSVIKGERGAGGSNQDESRSRIIASLIDWSKVTLKDPGDGSDPSTWPIDSLPIRRLWDVLGDPSFMSEEGILGILDGEGSPFGIEQTGFGIGTGRDTNTKEGFGHLFNLASLAAAAAALNPNDEDGKVKGVTSAMSMDMYQLSTIMGEFGDSNFIPLMPPGLVTLYKIMMDQQNFKTDYNENKQKGFPFADSSSITDRVDSLGGEEITVFRMPMGGEILTKDTTYLYGIPLKYVPDYYSFKKWLFDNKPAGVPDGKSASIPYYKKTGTDTKIPVTNELLEKFSLFKSVFTSAPASGNIILDSKTLDKFNALPMLVYDSVFGFRTTQDIPVPTQVIRPGGMTSEYDTTMAQRVTGAPSGSRFFKSNFIKRFRITLVDGKTDYVFVTEEQYDELKTSMLMGGDIITSIEPLWEDNVEEYTAILPNEFAEINILQIIEFMKTEDKTLASDGRLIYGTVSWKFDPNAKDERYPNGRFFRTREDLEIYYSELDEEERSFEIVDKSSYWDSLGYTDTMGMFHSDVFNSPISVADIEQIRECYEVQSDGSVAYQPTSESVWSSISPLEVTAIRGRKDLWKFDNQLGMFVNPELIELLGGSLEEFLKENTRYLRKIKLNSNPIDIKEGMVSIKQLLRVKPTKFYTELVNNIVEKYRGQTITPDIFQVYIDREIKRRQDEKIATFEGRQGFDDELGQNNPYENFDKQGKQSNEFDEDKNSDSQIQTLMSNSYINPRSIPLPYELHFSIQDGTNVRTESMVSGRSLFDAIQKWNELHQDKAIVVFDPDTSKKIMTVPAKKIFSVPMSRDEAIAAGVEIEWEAETVTNTREKRQLAFMQMWGIIQGFNDSTFVFPNGDTVFADYGHEVHMRRTIATIEKKNKDGLKYPAKVMTDAAFSAVWAGEDSEAQLINTDQDNTPTMYGNISPMVIASQYEDGNKAVTILPVPQIKATPTGNTAVSVNTVKGTPGELLLTPRVIRSVEEYLLYFKLGFIKYKDGVPYSYTQAKDAGLFADFTDPLHQKVPWNNPDSPDNFKDKHKKDSWWEDSTAAHKTVLRIKPGTDPEELWTYYDAEHASYTKNEFETWPIAQKDSKDVTITLKQSWDGKKKIQVDDGQGGYKILDYLGRELKLINEYHELRKNAVLQYSVGQSVNAEKITKEPVQELTIDNGKIVYLTVKEARNELQDINPIPKLEYDLLDHPDPVVGDEYRQSLEDKNMIRYYNRVTGEVVAELQKTNYPTVEAAIKSGSWELIPYHPDVMAIKYWKIDTDGRQIVVDANTDGSAPTGIGWKAIIYLKGNWHENIHQTKKTLSNGKIVDYEIRFDFNTMRPYTQRQWGEYLKWLKSPNINAYTDTELKLEEVAEGTTGEDIISWIDGDKVYTYRIIGTKKDEFFFGNLCEHGVSVQPLISGVLHEQNPLYGKNTLFGNKISEIYYRFNPKTKEVVRIDFRTQSREEIHAIIMETIPYFYPVTGIFYNQGEEMLPYQAITGIEDNFSQDVKQVCRTVIEDVEKGQETAFSKLTKISSLIKNLRGRGDGTTRLEAVLAQQKTPFMKRLLGINSIKQFLSVMNALTPRKQIVDHKIHATKIRATKVEGGLPKLYIGNRNIEDVFGDQSSEVKAYAEQLFNEDATKTEVAFFVLYDNRQVLALDDNLARGLDKATLKMDRKIDGTVNESIGITREVGTRILSAMDQFYQMRFADSRIDINGPAEFATVSNVLKMRNENVRLYETVKIRLCWDPVNGEWIDINLYKDRFKATDPKASKARKEVRTVVVSVGRDFETGSGDPFWEEGGTRKFEDTWKKKSYSEREDELEKLREKDIFESYEELEGVIGDVKGEKSWDIWSAENYRYGKGTNEILEKIPIDGLLSMLAQKDPATGGSLFSLDYKMIVRKLGQIEGIFEIPCDTLTMYGLKPGTTGYSLIKNYVSKRQVETVINNNGIIGFTGDSLITTPISLAGSVEQFNEVRKTEYGLMSFAQYMSEYMFIPGTGTGVDDWVIGNDPNQGKIFHWKETIELLKKDNSGPGNFMDSPDALKVPKPEMLNSPESVKKRKNAEWTSKMVDKYLLGDTSMSMVDQDVVKLTEQHFLKQPKPISIGISPQRTSIMGMEIINAELTDQIEGDRTIFIPHFTPYGVITNSVILAQSLLTDTTAQQVEQTADKFVGGFLRRVSESGRVPFYWSMDKDGPYIADARAIIGDGSKFVLSFEQLRATPSLSSYENMIKSNFKLKHAVRLIDYNLEGKPSYFTFDAYYSAVQAGEVLFVPIDTPKDQVFELWRDAPILEGTRQDPYREKIIATSDYEKIHLDKPSQDKGGEFRVRTLLNEVIKEATIDNTDSEIRRALKAMNYDLNSDIVNINDLRGVFIGMLAQSNHDANREVADVLSASGSTGWNPAVGTSKTEVIEKAYLHTLGYELNLLSFFGETTEEYRLSPPDLRVHPESGMLTLQDDAIAELMSQGKTQDEALAEFHNDKIWKRRYITQSTIGLFPPATFDGCEDCVTQKEAAKEILQEDAVERLNLLRDRMTRQISPYSIIEEARRINQRVRQGRIGHGQQGNTYYRLMHKEENMEWGQILNSLDMVELSLPDRRVNPNTREFMTSDDALVYLAEIYPEYEVFELLDIYHNEWSGSQDVTIGDAANYLRKYTQEEITSSLTGDINKPKVRDIIKLLNRNINSMGGLERLTKDMNEKILRKYSLTEVNYDENVKIATIDPNDPTKKVVVKLVEDLLCDNIPQYEKVPIDLYGYKAMLSTSIIFGRQVQKIIDEYRQREKSILGYQLQDIGKPSDIKPLMSAEDIEKVKEMDQKFTEDLKIGQNLHFPGETIEIVYKDGRTIEVGGKTMTFEVQKQTLSGTGHTVYWLYIRGVGFFHLSTTKMKGLCAGGDCDNNQLNMGSWPQGIDYQISMEESIRRREELFEKLQITEQEYIEMSETEKETIWQEYMDEQIRDMLKLDPSESTDILTKALAAKGMTALQYSYLGSENQKQIILDYIKDNDPVRYDKLEQEILQNTETTRSKDQQRLVNVVSAAFNKQCNNRVLMGKQARGSIGSNLLTSVLASLGGLLGTVVGYYLIEIIGNLITDTGIMKINFWEEVWNGTLAYVLALLGFLTDMEKIDTINGKVSVSSVGGKKIPARALDKEGNIKEGPIQEMVQEFITGIFTGVHMKAERLDYEYFQAVPWADNGDQIINGDWSSNNLELGVSQLVPVNIDPSTNDFTPVSTFSGNSTDAYRNFVLELYVDETPADAHNRTADVLINSTNFMFYDFNGDGQVNELDEFGFMNEDEHRTNKTLDFYYYYDIPLTAYREGGYLLPDMQLGRSVTQWFLIGDSDYDNYIELGIWGTHDETNGYFDESYTNDGEEIFVHRGRDPDLFNDVNGDGITNFNIGNDINNNAFYEIFERENEPKGAKLPTVNPESVVEYTAEWIIDFLVPDEGTNVPPLGSIGNDIKAGIRGYANQFGEAAATNTMGMFMDAAVTMSTLQLEVGVFALRNVLNYLINEVGLITKEQLTDIIVGIIQMGVQVYFFYVSGGLVGAIAGQIGGSIFNFVLEKILKMFPIPEALGFSTYYDDGNAGDIDGDGIPDHIDKNDKGSGMFSIGDGLERVGNALFGDASSQHYSGSPLFPNGSVLAEMYGANETTIMSLNYPVADQTVIDINVNGVHHPSDYIDVPWFGRSAYTVLPDSTTSYCLSNACYRMNDTILGVEGVTLDDVDGDGLTNDQEMWIISEHLNFTETYGIQNTLNTPNGFFYIDDDPLDMEEELWALLAMSNPDFDGDGLIDGIEVMYGSDMTLLDTDFDGIGDRDEFEVDFPSYPIGLFNGDNDLDGINDTDEVILVDGFWEYTGEQIVDQYTTNNKWINETSNEAWVINQQYIPPENNTITLYPNYIPTYYNETEWSGLSNTLDINEITRINSNYTSPENGSFELHFTKPGEWYSPQKMPVEEKGMATLTNLVATTNTEVFGASDKADEASDMLPTTSIFSVQYQPNDNITSQYELDLGYYDEWFFVPDYLNHSWDEAPLCGDWEKVTQSCAAISDNSLLGKAYLDVVWTARFENGTYEFDYDGDGVNETYSIYDVQDEINGTLDIVVNGATYNIPTTNGTYFEYSVVDLVNVDTWQEIYGMELEIKAPTDTSDWVQLDILRIKLVFEKVNPMRKQSVLREKNLSYEYQSGLENVEDKLLHQITDESQWFYEQWVYLNSTNMENSTQSPQAGVAFDDNNAFVLDVDNDNVELIINGSPYASNVTSNFNLTYDQWYHIAVVNDERFFNFVLNGQYIFFNNTISESIEWIGPVTKNIETYIDGISMWRTHPARSDTDGDYMNDYQEVNVYLTDPYDSDTDNDGLLDGMETAILWSSWDINATDGVNPYGLGVQMGVSCADCYRTSSPNIFDSDDDGLSDYEEFEAFIDFNDNLFPENNETYGSTMVTKDKIVAWTTEGPIWKTIEVQVDYYSTNPVKRDSDSDGLWDIEEILGKPASLITERVVSKPSVLVKTTIDGNEEEFGGSLAFAATNPNSADSDNDGIKDIYELHFGLDPLDRSDVKRPHSYNFTDGETDVWQFWDYYDWDGDGLTVKEEHDTVYDWYDHNLGTDNQVGGHDVYPFVPLDDIEYYVSDIDADGDIDVLLDPFTVIDFDKDGVTDYEEINGIIRFGEDLDLDGKPDYQVTGVFQSINDSIYAGAGAVDNVPFDSWINIIFPIALAFVPVIFASIKKKDDEKDDPGAHVAIKDVTTTGFKMQVEPIASGQTDLEMVEWVALNAGNYSVGTSTIEVGKFTHAGTSELTKKFDVTFNSTPAVITQMQTKNKVTPASWTRFDSVNETHILDLIIEEDNLTGYHDQSEDIGYIAVAGEESSSFYMGNYLIQNNGEWWYYDWIEVAYGYDYRQPLVFSHLQSRRDDAGAVMALLM